MVEDTLRAVAQPRRKSTVSADHLRLEGEVVGLWFEMQARLEADRRHRSPGGARGGPPAAASTGPEGQRRDAHRGRCAAASGLLGTADRTLGPVRSAEPTRADGPP